MPTGALKRTALPVPSALPETPGEPERVTTPPAGVMRRIVLLPVSATYTVPAASTARPDGYLNLAAEPAPSALPITMVEPAKVDTIPSGVIFRMVWLYESET